MGWHHPHTVHPNCKGDWTPLRYYSLWLPGVGESSWSSGRELTLWGLWREQALVRGCVCKGMHTRVHVCKGSCADEAAGIRAHVHTAACTKQQGSAHVWACLGLHLH